MTITTTEDVEAALMRELDDEERPWVPAAPYASRRLFSRAVTRHGVERSQHGSHNAPILHDLVLAEGPTR